MRRSDRSPSIVPPGNDHDVYLVLDDLRGGRMRSRQSRNAAISPVSARSMAFCVKTVA